MKDNLTAAVEALLFTYGEPLEVKRIAAILGLDEEKTQDAIGKLKEALQKEDRGLTLLGNQKTVQLITKPELSDHIKKLIRDDFAEELTPSALETLSILAYSDGLSKAEIDHVRGVNSSYVLRLLSLRGLIDKKEKKYHVSLELLKNLGVTQLADLPNYQTYQELLKKFRSQSHEA